MVTVKTKSTSNQYHIPVAMAMVHDVHPMFEVIIRAPDADVALALVHQMAYRLLYQPHPLFSKKQFQYKKGGKHLNL